MLYAAFILSIINSLLWIVFAVAIRNLFKKLLPMLTMLGVGGGVTAMQNLKYSTEYATMGVTPELGNKSNKTN